MQHSFYQSSFGYLCMSKHRYMIICKKETKTEKKTNDLQIISSIKFQLYIALNVLTKEKTKSKTKSNLIMELQ